ncbi:MAG: Gfo/Idh/MocA family oxidoreductase [Prolixibacteraceae bacterium]|nr:Gfo/Idh/MocA family oxidoreductase [Prolixibacteraceae bacterium]
MIKELKAGLIGCGDFLRWETDDLISSKFCKVKSTYDLDIEKSKSIANKIGAKAVTNVDEIFNDPEIKIVLIFTPPWVRKSYFEKAAKNSQHIITTKPFGSNLELAEELYATVKNKVNCAVFYGRSGNASVEQLKKVFDSDDIGKLSLYKEDWLHHYPVWNDWATDPDKNGGPFMDAMVHNLNKSRFLIGSEVETIDFISENHAQSLKCNDTEFMKLTFKNGASSYLFITWAADLEVFDPTGNDRVHFGILHMITDKGWYVTEEEHEGMAIIKAVKENQVKTWSVKIPELNKYDEFSLNLQKRKPQRYDVTDAIKDMRIIDKALKNSNPN